MNKTIYIDILHFFKKIFNQITHTRWLHVFHMIEISFNRVIENYCPVLVIKNSYRKGCLFSQMVLDLDCYSGHRISQNFKVPLRRKNRLSSFILVNYNCEMNKKGVLGFSISYLVLEIFWFFDICKLDSV